MNEYKVARKVKIDMPYLTPYRKEFHNSIKKILQDTFRFKFDNEMGYVISVQKIDKIGPIHLDYKGFGYSTIDFNVKCLNPKKGDRLDCVVKYIFSHIIIVHLYDIDIIIPYQELEKLNLVFDKNEFKNNTNSIKIGDTIKVEILHTKFSNKKLKCIGKIIF